MWESRIRYRVCTLVVNALGSRRGHSRYLHIHYSNKNLSTDELQLSLTLEPTTIQVVKTSLTVPVNTHSSAVPHKGMGMRWTLGRSFSLWNSTWWLCRCTCITWLIPGTSPHLHLVLFFNTFALYLRYLSGNPWQTCTPYHAKVSLERHCLYSSLDHIACLNLTFWLERISNSTSLEIMVM